MTSHELAHSLLARDEVVIEAYDAIAEMYKEVSGYVYAHGISIELLTEDIE